MIFPFDCFVLSIIFNLLQDGFLCILYIYVCIHVCIYNCSWNVYIHLLTQLLTMSYVCDPLTIRKMNHEID